MNAEDRGSIGTPTNTPGPGALPLRKPESAVRVGVSIEGGVLWSPGRRDKWGKCPESRMNTSSECPQHTQINPGTIRGQTGDTVASDVLTFAPFEVPSPPRVARPGGASDRKALREVAALLDALPRLREEAALLVLQAEELLGTCDLIEQRIDAAAFAARRVPAAGR